MVTIDILVVDETLLENISKQIAASAELSSDGYVAAYNGYVHGCAIVSIDVENMKANVIPLHPELIGEGEFDTPPICKLVIAARNSMYGSSAILVAPENASKFLSLDVRLSSIIKKKMIFGTFDEVKRLKTEFRTLNGREYQETTYAMVCERTDCKFIAMKHIPTDVLKTNDRERILDATRYVVQSGLMVDKFIGLLKNG